MRIIKNGKVYEFKCDACGCIWEAGEHECFNVEGKGYQYKCPDCGKTITSPEPRKPHAKEDVI